MAETGKRLTFVSHKSPFVMRRDRTAAERFCYNLRICNDGCWYWMGSLDHWGYGIMSGREIGRKAMKAHRMAYILFNGELPDNLDIDHLCRNRRCVNPEHLEAVTREVNNQRAFIRAFCKHGHRMTGRNVQLVNKIGRRNKERRCKKCEGAKKVAAKRGCHYSEIISA